MVRRGPRTPPTRVPPGRSGPPSGGTVFAPYVRDPVSSGCDDHVDPLPVGVAAAAFAPGPVHREPPDRSDSGPRFGPHVGQRLRAAGVADAGADAGPRGVRAGDQTGRRQGVERLCRTPGPPGLPGRSEGAGDDDPAPRGQPQLVPVPPGRFGEQPPLGGGEPAERYTDADRGHGRCRCRGRAAVRCGDRARGRSLRRTRPGAVDDRARRRPDGAHQRGAYVVGQVLHAPRAGVPGGAEEQLGGQERGARAVRRGQPEHLVGGPDPQEAVAALRDQRHVRAQRVHVTATGVQGEEEAAGERGGGGRPAHQGVQLGQPAADRGRSVESGERRGHDVAGPLVRGRRQQPGGAEQFGRPAAALRVEAAQLYVAPRGEMQLTVPEPAGHREQRVRPVRAQHPAGDAYPGQRTVVGPVQPQRSRAGVTAVAGGCAARGKGRGGGIGHGGEHTDRAGPVDGPAPVTCGTGRGRPGRTGCGRAAGRWGGRPAGREVRGVRPAGRRSP